jgi:hypothetical protein
MRATGSGALRSLYRSLVRRSRPPGDAG